MKIKARGHISTAERVSYRNRKILGDKNNVSRDAFKMLDYSELLEIKAVVRAVA